MPARRQVTQGGQTFRLKNWSEVLDPTYSPTYSAYLIQSAYVPDSVSVNGVQLPSSSDRSEAKRALEAGVAKGCWVQESGQLFLIGQREFLERTPWNTTVQAMIPFYFATHPKTFLNSSNTDVYYEPRIDSLPNLSLRLEAQFGGVSQIGGGSLNLNNGGGYFSDLQHLHWDAGETKLYLGVDLPGAPLSRGEYASIGYWENGSYDCGPEAFTLQLTEQKGRLKKKVPLEIYTLDNTYDGVDPKAIGRPIPLAYGTVLGVTPTKIGTAFGDLATYKVANHPIKGVLRIRKKISGNWQDIEPADNVVTDPSTATFTVGNPAIEELSVDFEGKLGLDGNLIQNAADIVKDLLEVIGEKIDGNSESSAALEQARRSLRIGLRLDTGELVDRGAISLYVDKSTGVLDILDQVNRAIGSYLYVGLDGTFNYSVFSPVAGETTLNSLPPIEEDVIQSFDMTTDPDVISRVLVSYAERPAEDWSESYQEERESIRHTHGEPVRNTLEEELPFTRFEDARYWAQRTLIMRGQPGRLFNVSLHWKGILYPPGSQVAVRYRKNGFHIDEVLEVLEQSIDLKGNKVSLVLGDRRGFARCGFWAPGTLDHQDPDDPTSVYVTPPMLPDRYLGLAGYAAEPSTSDIDGSAARWKKNWHPDIKAWARQNIGYWCDENGFADPTDPDSYMLTRWF